MVTLSISDLYPWTGVEFQTVSNTAIVTNTFFCSPVSTGTFDLVFTAVDIDGATMATMRVDVVVADKVPEQESFGAGSLPSGWSIVNSGDPSAEWVFNDPAVRGNNTGGDGTFAIADSDDAGSVDMDTELRTPVMDLSDMATVWLSVNTEFVIYTGNETADIDVSVNGPSGPWVNVWHETADFTASPLEVDISSEAAGQANVMIRFHYYDANYDYYWAIDDVAVYGQEKLDTDSDGMPGWWEALYFGSSTSCDPTLDGDFDGLSNLEECLAGTAPDDGKDVFRSEGLNDNGASGIRIRWRSAYGRQYSVFRATDVTGTFSIIDSNLVATPPVNQYDDSSAVGGSRYFYRIDLE